ncbi:pimeloyl-ACP methyl ester carboxylesterase [Thermocatellispora tengchongensis]|uniref:Pimeloyl-ACP methyl ester carboxylesterase n=1 Tax=Thermocatellispora tengchongensis TaxID=1073253 RepID=A0A840PGY3_9ACTN|nr:alpha/beta hydrolase [Thermocatellispora tengchongensis]MBB5138392.1 pimeloyl-ACP methyl ester carboxylesterase [Thermocatellispora tengchongensis]
MSATASRQEFALLPDPRPARRRWVTVSTGEHVSGVAWGAGPPEALLLHAAGGSARDWDGALSAFGHPAVALDLPGHGGSSRRPTALYAPRRLVLPVAEAVESLAPTAEVVAATGLGALTALALSARRPELVRALILLDTLPGHPAPGENPPKDAGTDDEALWERLAGLAAEGTPVTVLHRVLPDSALARLREHAPAARLVPYTSGTADAELAALLRAHTTGRTS